MASPPSTISHHLLSQNSLKFSAATLKQYMNEKDRSVSNNDDVVHVLDKSKASAMYESGGEASQEDVDSRGDGKGEMMMILHR
jgi:hypothetical protein